MRKILTCFFLAAALSAFAEDKPAETPPPAPPSIDDVSYAFGMLIGQSLVSTGVEVNLDQVFQALRDTQTKGAPLKFDAAHAKELVSEAVSAAREKQASAKMEEEKSFLAEHAKKAGVTTTKSGLQYEVLKQGTGEKPKETDTVKVDYVGTLIDGTEFDSSIKRGQPAVFPLGQVIPAWTEGLQLMPVGSKFRFTIPSGLAYGAQGAGDVIPPYATLVFEVELIDIEAPAKDEPEASPAPAQ